ncbi:MAG: hypothetical protein JW850_12505 [Thermoflexales bacterium]|nr:hypothetical protein [Thermoflexales bacterium]
MTIDDVLARIDRADELNLLDVTGYYFCAVCYRRANHVISIYGPLGEVIPLCEVHLGDVEQALQETPLHKSRVVRTSLQSTALSP